MCEYSLDISAGQQLVLNWAATAAEAAVGATVK